MIYLPGAGDLLGEERETLEEQLWRQMVEGLAVAAGMDTEGAEANARLWQQASRATPEVSLAEFVRGAWHVVEPGRELVWNWHIDAICEHLEGVSRGDIRQLIVNVPPRHMKSLLVSVFWPAWEWHYMPWTRWLYASFAEKLSKRDAVKTRRLIGSPWYRRRWGHVYSLTSDQNEKLRYENSMTGYRIATSVGGSSTGEGGDRVVVDDALKAGHAHSAARREYVNEWWDEEMSNRVNDPQRSARVMIAQRLHEGDLTGHVLAHSLPGEWDHVWIPNEYMPTKPVMVGIAVGDTPADSDASGQPARRPPPRPAPATSIGWEDPRTEAGELLWPERMTPEVVAETKRTLGSYGYAGQYQQVPSPDEGGIFKRTWWRFWQPSGHDLGPVAMKLPDGTHEDVEVVAIPLHLDFVGQSWDMTFKGHTETDWVVGQAWGLHGANHYLLHQVRGHWEFRECLPRVKKLRKDYPDGPVWVEDKANGPAIMSALRDEVPGMVGVEPDGDKVARAWAQQPLVEAGNVLLPHPRLAPWVWDFIEEWAVFPNADNDDQVDAGSQALNRMRKWRAAHHGGAGYTLARR